MLASLVKRLKFQQIETAVKPAVRVRARLEERGERALRSGRTESKWTPLGGHPSHSIDILGLLSADFEPMGSLCFKIQLIVSAYAKLMFSCLPAYVQLVFWLGLYIDMK